MGTGTDWLASVGSIGVSSSSVSLPDRILLDGACNVREIGGYRTATGGQVRRGLVYRADRLHRLTEEDVQSLRGLQITTVVDLRRHDEVERFGRGPVASWADVVLHPPLRHEAAERRARLLRGPWERSVSATYTERTPPTPLESWPSLAAPEPSMFE